MIPRTQVLLWVFLGGMFIVGIAFNVLAHELPEAWQLRRKLLEEIGVALLIASLLGLTVDRVLKIEIARDVFYAAFRYVLPEELKAEVARIIDYRFVCTDHHSVVEIEEVEGGLVRVRMSTERVLKNISRQTEAVCNRFAIDDWGLPGHQSCIEQCSLELGGQKIHGKPNPEYNQRDSLGFITEERNVKSGETIKLVTRGHEFHRTNSVLLMGYRAPSIRPVLDIRLPEGYKHKVSFGVPGERVVQSEITRRYILDGAQFPSQNIWIRWWKDDASSSAAPPS